MLSMSDSIRREADEVVRTSSISACIANTKAGETFRSSGVFVACSGITIRISHANAFKRSVTSFWNLAEKSFNVIRKA